MAGVLVVKVFGALGWNCEFPEILGSADDCVGTSPHTGAGDQTPDCDLIQGSRRSNSFLTTA
jgi:hypothetical protein